MDIGKHIEVNPAISMGKPVIKEPVFLLNRCLKSCLPAKLKMI